MLSKKVLKELLEATARYPGGLVVLEENKPKFVILDYESYQKILAGKNKAAVPVTPKKILVTGGAGYIGSHAARLLVEKGFNVTTLDNLSTGFSEFAQGNFIEGDLADTELLDRVFSEGNFDAVMHFAASIEVEESTKNPTKYYRNNVACGLNLLEAMARHGVSNLVFSSSCTVYSEDVEVPISEIAVCRPTSPYGETKLAFEQMLKWFSLSHGLQSVTLRYFNAAGASFDSSLGLANPDSTLLIPNALNVACGKKELLDVFGGDYRTQDGTAIRDYIHVLDLAEAHLLSLNYLFGNASVNPLVETFNVGTGTGFSVLEIINAICERTGRMVRFEIAPRRPGDRERVIADPAKIRRILGFEPRFSDLQTIIDTSWAFHKRRFGPQA